ncbi:hypothetical protein [Cohnella yongneupensis]|uniref:Uncharacterized protein n=1 Tax=Cohnella yongneupensis TaxID=425006 RepID=A0ABW0QTX9_9BACL
MNQFATMLAEKGLASGPVYVTVVLKGHEAARMVADFKAQHTIRPMTERILVEAASDPLTIMIERLSKLYHSDYVAHNRPEIRAVPYREWLERELAKKGMTLRE